ncbi:CRISPR-associated endonuclease Cas1 [Nitrosopumilus sp. b3]|uniref:CRISPR-associated endonuclease Cas1 n=1 Tax=Nitrosopumilus sp. b3 TaxID=2109909 RepID=UPI0015F5DF0C|nr:CRISPR-associated endonuclease Cas1 [Nitrosopumilus sp. b3]KAF6246417.1 CRISPR-associated endonuclease Cas1 [Nitrosopumilus sp. b3]
MNPLLISGFGTSINVDKRKLVVTNKLQNKRLEFAPHKIEHDSIIIDGHTGNISFESMRWLMKHNIHLTLLNWDGNLLATTLPDQTISGKLRLFQYKKHLDGIIRYSIAEKIVKSKIDSSLNLLLELSKFYPIDKNEIKKRFEAEFEIFRTKSAKNTHKIPEIMGHEARIAKIYFEYIRDVFGKLAPQFSFETRSSIDHKRADHAADEINALLNYGYSILAAEIKKSLNSVGLDTQIGFLHETLLSRTPLVYDCQELFRWLIDLSVIQLLEENKLKKSDFILTENYHIRLKQSTAKLLVDKIKYNFNLKVSYGKKYFAYQNILNNNISQLAQFVGDRKKTLEIKIPPIKINRDDNLELRQKILSMSPEEGKKLGINKSTLWYMKKNVQSKDKMKIYDKILEKLE